MGRHVQDGGVVGLEPARPTMVGRLTAASARGGNHHPPRAATSGQAAPENGCRGGRRRHSRNDFPGNSRLIERRNFLIKPPEQRWVAPLQPNDDRIFLRRAHQ